MATFHLDQNVSSRIGEELEALGHSAITAYQLGMGAAEDDEHFLVAAHYHRIVITNNRKDFILLNHAWERWQARWHSTNSHSGVLIIPALWSAADAAREIDALVQQYSDNFDDLLFEWRNSGWQTYPLKTTHPLP